MNRLTRMPDDEKLWEILIKIIHLYEESNCSEIEIEFKMELIETFAWLLRYNRDRRFKAK